MKAISQIDRALKRLYNLHSQLQAEDFLLRFPYSSTPDQAPAGALYIQPPTATDDSLSLGIYLNASVRDTLGTFPEWSNNWSGPQLAAFGLAAEEVSHFHYVAHHAPQGRGVSQLELEFQGEIDRFLLTFFAQKQIPFTDLMEQFFQKFQWKQGLTADEKTRYEEASRLAKAFLVKSGPLLRGEQMQDLLKALRQFYRMSLEEKVSLATR